MVERLSETVDKAAINVIRGLAMDAPLYAKSGHQGTAMALAPLAHVLYSRILRHDPSRPHWPDRDRFILSNGHASILQYALLFLSGYGLEIEDLKQFRQWNSATPGHPEVGHTAGIEVTTGPLGQGFANAVGMAIAESHLRSVHGENNQNHHIYVIAGDGCLMEGVSHEAASLAGHLQLDRLVVVFDDNKITIDGETDLTCSDDVPARFASYGWNVMQLGEVAEDCDAIEQALIAARDHKGAPTLVVLRSHIAHPSPDLTDHHEAHGNPFTADHVSRTKVVMGIPDEPFWAPDDVVSAYRTHCAQRGRLLRREWEQHTGESRSDFNAAWSLKPRTDPETTISHFAPDVALATRQALQKVIDQSLTMCTTLMSGAADLTGNTGVKMSGQKAFSSKDRNGRQVFYGIREHAMGSALVGMALHGGVLPVGGTFFVFADYMRPAIRLAALSRARCIFVFSHDSVGVGEDGPTHQPIEQLASLRAIPGLHVVRPADPEETRAAWIDAISHDGPTAIVLSRQTVPALTDGGAVRQGAGVIVNHKDAEAVVIATGSEVSVAIAAHDKLLDLGVSVSVVSMPSWDRFDIQSEEFKDFVLPPHLPVVSIEAGTTFGWHQWADSAIGIDRFGASAPGSTVMANLGITADAVVTAVCELLED